MTHGGMGYAKEFHVERYMREVMIARLAPVSPQLILCFIAEKVLGLPKSIERSGIDARPFVPAKAGTQITNIVTRCSGFRLRGNERR